MSSNSDSSESSLHSSSISESDSYSSSIAESDSYSSSEQSASEFSWADGVSSSAFDPVDDDVNVATGEITRMRESEALGMRTRSRRTSKQGKVKQGRSLFPGQKSRSHAKKDNAKDKPESNGTESKKDNAKGDKPESNGTESKKDNAKGDKPESNGTESNEEDKDDPDAMESNEEDKDDPDATDLSSDPGYVSDYDPEADEKLKQQFTGGIDNCLQRRRHWYTDKTPSCLSTKALRAMLRDITDRTDAYKSWGYNLRPYTRNGGKNLTNDHRTREGLIATLNELADDDEEVYWLLGRRMSKHQGAKGMWNETRAAKHFRPVLITEKKSKGRATGWVDLRTLRHLMRNFENQHRTFVGEAVFVRYLFSPGKRGPVNAVPYVNALLARKPNWKTMGLIVLRNDHYVAMYVTRHPDREKQNPPRIDFYDPMGMRGLKLKPNTESPEYVPIGSIGSMVKKLIEQKDSQLHGATLRAHKKDHQGRNTTECGVYVAWYMKQRVRNRKSFKFIESIEMPAEEIRPLRAKYFAKPKEQVGRNRHYDLLTEDELTWARGDKEIPPGVIPQPWANIDAHELSD
jgi:hypothetical protein